jgi:hypothetical protein
MSVSRIIYTCLLCLDQMLIVGIEDINFLSLVKAVCQNFYGFYERFVDLEPYVPQSSFRTPSFHIFCNGEKFRC